MMGKAKTHPGAIGFSMFFSGMRFLLYAAVLVLSALCTFRPDLLGGFDAFNFYAAFIALLPMPFVTMFSNLRSGKKKTGPADGAKGNDGK